MRYFGSDFSGESSDLQVSFRKYAPDPDDVSYFGIDYQSYQLLTWAMKIIFLYEDENRDCSEEGVDIEILLKRYIPIVNTRIEQISKELADSSSKSS